MKKFLREKKQNGSYFSKKIWQFRMRCHLCPNYIVIQTDPKNTEYVVMEGANRKIETYEHDENSGITNMPTEEEAQKLAEDPFYKLEYSLGDQKRAQEAAPVLTELMDFKDRDYNDFENSRMLRKNFRTKRKEIEALKKEGEQLNLGVPLLPKDKMDQLEASQIKFKSSGIVVGNMKRKLNIKSQSIFGGTPSNKKHKNFVELLTKQRTSSNPSTITSSS